MTQRSAAERLVLMEAALERAAETIGDLTGPVIARLYRRCPEAAEAFARLGLGDTSELEGRMVTTTLFCLMQWIEEPVMIEVIIHDTLPHHCLTLGIHPTVFRALAEETADIIIETIPADRPDERAVWLQLRSALLGVVAEATADPHLARMRKIAPNSA